MGIEPFLLSSSLIGVLAQRLVRVLNPETRQAFTAGEYERRLLGLEPDEPSPTLYRPGRDAGGGYRGRTGIYELIMVDDHAAHHDPRRRRRAGARALRAQLHPLDPR